MPAKRSSTVAARLLAWYDANARALPWRSAPGSNAPDPYRVWLSEIMLQQTTVATVRPRFEAFIARWPTVESLAAASDADLMAAWAGLGYYARARNLIACARTVVADHSGHFPDSEAGLRALPGIGDYTAAAIAAIAFGRRAVAVDANVARVVARLDAIDAPLPGSMPIIRRAADAMTPDTRAGDFAQAMMDLGSSICTSRNPRCLLCPLIATCRAQAGGDPARYPVKAAKAARPHKYGTVFWAEADGAVLLVRRPDKGLLGGMRALPTGPWADAPPGLAGAPDGTDWRLIQGTVSHGFTHFTLDLALAVGTAVSHAAGEWWAIADIESAGLPTVFAKAAKTIRRA
ncbi:A/G-specific adenine glycosylase [Sphingomonas sp. AR_OL41]|uniref:A/G-specific adenine glycosylase n=1 Tax=Sphingomonas sp. AR_OL41 TaxID=3042729 RepID=UPI00248065AD|nr:A/G-specific adenine glycosylase [Sphingomonas sp. AR_OL41]MDH7975841.1 A/G-specific adenine glycosylase [Sphingomonas sp. AR_OL41]